MTGVDPHPLTHEATPMPMEAPLRDGAIRIRQATAMDWLLRTVLPILLAEAQRERLASPLREHPPIDAPELLHDRYVLSRLSTTLRQKRGEIHHELQSERRWAARGQAGSTARQFGGPQRFRSILFPHLDEVTAWVARSVTARQVGPLLKECIDLGVELIAACNDNDQKTPPTTEFSALMNAYDRALAALADSRASGAEETAEVERREGFWTERIEKSRGSARYSGVFGDGRRTYRCAHLHSSNTSAEKCARLLARRARRGELSPAHS